MDAWAPLPSLLPSFSFKIVFTDTRERGFCKAGGSAEYISEHPPSWPLNGHFSVHVLCTHPYTATKVQNSIYLKLFLLKNVYSLRDFPSFLDYVGFFPPPFFSASLHSSFHLNLDIAGGGQCWTIVSPSHKWWPLPRSSIVMWWKSCQAGGVSSRKYGPVWNSFGGNGVSAPSCCVAFPSMTH